ncbi:hypothetical protein MKZ24_00890 [Paenibacillus sp. FSL R7-0297]|uniref:hypothetical protein n=1 Tax=Paenibacillus sp. FSL R7-0297 TaxID=2921680 RepID=UPI0030F8C417
MNRTKLFQEDLAQKLTLMIDRYFHSIKENDSSESLNRKYREVNIAPVNYASLGELEYKINTFDEEQDDAKFLLLASKLCETEIINIHSMIPRGHIKPKPKLLLECISESLSKYYKNDRPEHIGPYTPKDKIYSPVVDIGISPSVQLRRGEKHHSLAVYPLLNGRLIFDCFSNLLLIQRLAEQLERIAKVNFEKLQLPFYWRLNNIRPLSLFAIEIENQPNNKHLLGDFLNCLMLSRYPILLVPENRLDACFEVVKLTRFILDVKQINVFDLLSQVCILSVGQFRDIINPLLIGYNIEPLIFPEYR